MSIFGNNNSELLQQIEAIESKYEELKQQMAVLEKANAEVKQELALIQARMDELTKKRELEIAKTEDTILVKPEQDKSSSFYAGAPTSDGCFIDITTQENEGSSIYRFTRIDEKTASFELIDSPDSIAIATISLSQFVKPVCKILGAPMAQPRHVLNVQVGTVVLDGEGWRVIDKAVIQLS